jgi:hypothetical protein
MKLLPVNVVAQAGDEHHGHDDHHAQPEGGIECSPGWSRRSSRTTWRGWARRLPPPAAPRRRRRAVRFPGDSSWATELQGKHELERWLQRFVRVGLQIYPDEAVAKGPPWNTKVCVAARSI